VAAWMKNERRFLVKDYFMHISVVLMVFVLPTMVFGNTFPIKGLVYCYGTGKPTSFVGLDITCIGITMEKGNLLIKGKNIPLFVIQEISFPKHPTSAIKFKLKNGKVFRIPAKKTDAPLCIITFKMSGGLLPLDSFDIDRVVFR